MLTRVPVTNPAEGFKESHFDDLGTIEVLVLRCQALQKADADYEGFSSGEDSDFFGDRSTQEEEDKGAIVNESLAPAPTPLPVTPEEEIGGVLGLGGGLFDGPSDFCESVGHDGPNDGGRWVWHQRQSPPGLHADSVRYLPYEQRFRSPSHDYAAGYPAHWQGQDHRNLSGQSQKHVHWDWGSNSNPPRRPSNEQSSKRPSDQGPPPPPRPSSYNRMRSNDRRPSGPLYLPQQVNLRERKPSQAPEGDDRYRDEPPHQWAYGNESTSHNNSAGHAQQQTQGQNSGWDNDAQHSWGPGSGSASQGDANAPRQSSQASGNNILPPNNSSQPSTNPPLNALPTISQPWPPQPPQPAPSPSQYMPGPPPQYFPWPMPMPGPYGQPQVPHHIPYWPTCYLPNMQPSSHMAVPPGSGTFPPLTTVPGPPTEGISPKDTSFNQLGHDIGKDTGQDSWADKTGNAANAANGDNGDQDWGNDNHNGSGDNGWDNNNNGNNNVNNGSSWNQDNDNGNGGNQGNDDWNNTNNNDQNNGDDSWGNDNNNMGDGNGWQNTDNPAGNGGGNSWGNDNNATQANTSGNEYGVNGGEDSALQPAEEPTLTTDITRNLYGPHGPYYSLRAINLDEPKPDAEEEPRFDVPKSIAIDRRSTKQVQPGPGYRYYKKSITPEYIDTLDSPYARFVFKYRTKEQLLDETGIEVDVEPSSSQEVTELQNLDKHTLVEMLMRAKSALGGKVPSPPATPVTAAGSEDGIPVAVPAPSYPYLKYSLPPLRPMTANTNRKAPDQAQTSQKSQSKEKNASWGNTKSTAANNISGDAWGITNTNTDNNQNWDSGGGGGGGNWDGPPASGPAKPSLLPPLKQNQQRQGTMQHSAQSRQNSQATATGASNRTASYKGTPNIPPRPEDDPKNRKACISPPLPPLPPPPPSGACGEPIEGVSW